MAELNVPITKSKGFIVVDTDKIPEDVYREALMQGLKVLLNRGSSKITKETYPNADELKVAAQAKAQEQLELVMTSKIRFSAGGKAKKASGVVMTEARRLAKNLVKDEMKRQKIKISHVEASEITKAANALLEEMPEIIEQAKANVAEREKVVVASATGIISSIKISDKKVKAAEAKKAKDKEQLSAKQAGKPKARPQAQPQG